MILVKLGGAAITEKGDLKTLRRDALYRLGRELGDAPEPLVVVHGAGSFGHIRAKAHRLDRGLTSANRAGFSRVHIDVRELHLQVLESLLAGGVEPVSVPPGMLARLAGGRLVDLTSNAITEALSRGLTPVTFGDAVFDGEIGGSIVSGDTLMYEIGRALRPTRAVFVTNVDGIYDRDPSQEGATLQATLTPDALLDAGTGASGAPDVTGGMAGKARHMADLARRGVPVTVVNGAVPGRVADAVAGKPVTGTVIA